MENTSSLPMEAFPSKQSRLIRGTRWTWTEDYEALILVFPPLRVPICLTIVRNQQQNGGITVVACYNVLSQTEKHSLISMDMSSSRFHMPDQLPFPRANPS